MYKAIIFDFFGVIQADPYQRWLNKHGFKREGAFAEAVDTADRGQATTQDFFEKLQSLSGEPIDVIKQAFFEGKQADEELVKLIKQLKTNYKIGLLSNSQSTYLRPILQQQGIDSLFDEIIISSEVGIIKPDIEVFKLTLERMGIKVDEAIFIDDRDYNIDAAVSIGLKSILYRDLASLKEDLAKLEATI